MPTPHRAFAAVAAALTQIDPQDRGAVETFYRRRFLEYPPEVRALISDFLVGLTSVPSKKELSRLKKVVDGPAAEVPHIGAPAWPAEFGPAMDYLPAPPRRKTAAERSVAAGAAVQES